MQKCRLSDERTDQWECDAMLRPAGQWTTLSLTFFELGQGGSEPNFAADLTDHMLQRKQSLFLALAALLAFSTWLFPSASYQRGETTYELRTSGLFTTEEVEVVDVGLKMPFSIVLTLLGVALLVTVFLYKGRPRQMRFVRGTYLLMLGVIAYMFITDRSVLGYLEEGGAVSASYGLSFILPIVALVLSVMAERAIKADEELVRSADRLR